MLSSSLCVLLCACAPTVPNPSVEPSVSPGFTFTPSASPSQSAAPDAALSLEQQYAPTDEDFVCLSVDECSPITLNGTDAQFTAEGVSVLENALIISGPGAYCLKGTWDGTVEIRAAKNDAVVLLLDGVELRCADGAAISAFSGQSLTVSLSAGSENVLTDCEVYSRYSGEDAPSAALYSQCDLLINGEGSLTVTGKYNDGISGRDAVTIAGGNLVVSAKDDGVIGRDALVLAGGTLTVDAEDDGLRSTYDKDNEKGLLMLTGGTLSVRAGGSGLTSKGEFVQSGGTAEITSGKKAVHADRILRISGGSLTSTECNEGLESYNVLISGGEIAISATDDAINASSPEGKDVGWAQISVSGGTLHLSAQEGDGMDSNGDLFISGGSVTVFGPAEGPSAAFDCDGRFVLTGGIVMGTGAPDKAAPPESDTQPVVTVRWATPCPSGTTLTLADSSGNTIAQCMPTDGYSYAVFSHDSLRAGEDYLLCWGDLKYSFTVQGGVTALQLP